MRIQGSQEKLIFLISQPRAGSTMLQRILGSHPEIHTVSEPWLMLHPLYGLRAEGYQAEYDQHQASVGLHDFLRTLPEQEEEYFEGVRRMCSYLYQKALAGTGKRYFLDKTPRYYLVIPELHRTFPGAHFIILLRNPVAVLCSILHWRVKRNWLKLHRFGQDLTLAPRLLLDAIDSLRDHCLVVHYEELVREPASELGRICCKLGVGFNPSMVKYGGHTFPHWRLGDQDTIDRHSEPAPEYIDRWIRGLRHPVVWRLANDYLHFLGNETIQRMGYSFEELVQVLEAHQHHRVRWLLAPSLSWLLEAPLSERNGWIRARERLSRAIRRRGFRRMAVDLIRKAAGGISDPI